MSEPADDPIQDAAMIEVVGFRDRDTWSLGFARVGSQKLSRGDLCVIRTRHGTTLAEAVTAPRLVDAAYLADSEVEFVRVANRSDLQRLEKLSSKERRAARICREKIRKRQMQMKLIRVRYSFEEPKIVFYFTADGRVDFRELVRDLAYAFKCRIEMRQVGVRDEAKMLGGLGCCGLPLCCSQFLRHFDTVSIRMAKEQGLSLIPSKISGICGRLMCCLKYEYESYVEAHRRVPKQGRRVMTPKGLGKIKQICVPRGVVRVELPGGEEYVMPIPEEDPPEAQESAERKERPAAKKEARQGQGSGGGRKSRGQRRRRRSDNRSRKGRRCSRQSTAAQSTSASP
jgi:cell fate regulator YaaT (PSP1 superfamily)